MSPVGRPRTGRQGAYPAGRRTGAIRVWRAPAPARYRGAVRSIRFVAGGRADPTPERAWRRPEGLAALRAAVCGVAVILLGGREILGGDRDACRQTGEFGNYGCARVAGRVVGSAGQPLPGVNMSLREQSSTPETAGCYNPSFRKTDASGRFRVELTRYCQRGAPNVPDTLTVVVYAARTTFAPGERPVADSATVVVTVARVGRVPPEPRLDFRLPVP